MSDYDDWGWHDAAADEADRQADDEHEMAVAQHFKDLEADDERRARETNQT